jgi:restriction endonuclease S subunit
MHLSNLRKQIKLNFNNMANWENINITELSFGLRLDPEYYQTKYLNLRKSLMNNNCLNILSLKEDICYGLQAEPEYLNEGIKYIRAMNLKDIGISGEILKISKNQIISASNLLKSGDILITRSGANCGDVSVVDDYYKNATYGSYIIRIRLKNINPFIVYVFLLSKYGRFQTNQIRTGLAQPNLSIPYIENLLIIPNFLKIDFQNHIELLIKECFTHERNIDEFYHVAQQEIFERINWVNFNSSHTLSYYVDKAAIDNYSRLDPEFFQPKFINLYKFLRKEGSIQISEFCPLPKRGVSPEYFKEGDILIVNSQNLSANGIIDVENLEKSSLEFYNNHNHENSRLKKYDVLTYATGAYIGRTNCWLEEDKAIAGIDCIITQPKTSICDPVYLSLFLNSEPGLMQSKQRASGSAQRHLYPNDLYHYLIYIPKNKNGKPDLEWQHKLANKVIQAYEAKKEARKKLKEAIDLVEKETEKMIQS